MKCGEDSEGVVRISDWTSCNVIGGFLRRFSEGAAQAEAARCACLVGVACLERLLADGEATGSCREWSLEDLLELASRLISEGDNGGSFLGSVCAGSSTRDALLPEASSCSGEAAQSGNSSSPGLRHRLLQTSPRNVGQRKPGTSPSRSLGIAANGAPVARRGASPNAGASATRGRQAGAASAGPGAMRGAPSISAASSPSGHAPPRDGTAGRSPSARSSPPARAPSGSPRRGVQMAQEYLQTRGTGGVACPSVASSGAPTSSSGDASSPTLVLDHQGKLGAAVIEPMRNPAGRRRSQAAPPPRVVSSSTAQRRTSSSSSSLGPAGGDITRRVSSNPDARAGPHASAGSRRTLD